MEWIMKHRFSVVSGALACLASVLGKVAFDTDAPFHTTARDSCRDRFDDSVTCSLVGLAVQALSLAGMVTVNALMISMYLRALQQSGSTVATVMNCAANFLLSGVSGMVLFGERLPALWLCGATCIISGVALISGGNVPPEMKKKDE